jgi:HPr kinase/phosphorylase
MFGIRSTRVRKRIEVVVELEEWQDKANYERTGLEEKTTTLLDVELPFVRIPIVSGKNLTVIAEVVALNHSLKLVGMNPPVELNQRLVDIMKQKKSVKYDQEDYE